jgi:hypothetical protein
MALNELKQNTNRQSQATKEIMGHSHRKNRKLDSTNPDRSA